MEPLRLRIEGETIEVDEAAIAQAYTAGGQALALEALRWAGLHARAVVQKAKLEAELRQARAAFVLERIRKDRSAAEWRVKVLWETTEASSAFALGLARAEQAVVVTAAIAGLLRPVVP